MFELVSLMPLSLIIAFFSGWLIVSTMLFWAKIVSTIKPHKPLGPYRKKFFGWVEKNSTISYHDPKLLMIALVIGIVLLVLSFSSLQELFVNYFESCEHWEESCYGLYAFVSMAASTAILLWSFIFLLMGSTLFSLMKVFDLAFTNIKDKIKTVKVCQKVITIPEDALAVILAIIIIAPAILFLGTAINYYNPNFTQIMLSEFLELDYEKVQPVTLFPPHDFNVVNAEENRISYTFFLRNNTNFEKPITYIYLDCVEYKNYPCLDEVFILEPGKVKSFTCEYPSNESPATCVTKVQQTNAYYYQFEFKPS